jgi:deoxyribose-phosphate aldolase
MNSIAVPVYEFRNSPAIDQVGVEERISRLSKRSIKKESKLAALKLALSMVDLTTLEARDTPGKVRQLCIKAMHPHDAVSGIPSVAAVCVYKNQVGVGKKKLR